MRKSLLIGLALAILAAFVLVYTAPAAADTLWYNGDSDGGALANEINTEISQALVYDNFIVPTAGWTINTVWSNNLMYITVTLASWEIRSGVSSGNGGTLVASGTGAATQTATGSSPSGHTEYTVQVSGLNVNLGPGTYWLNVTPIGSGSGLSYNLTTRGANAVGLPPGNDGNSFFDSTNFGYTFAPTSEPLLGFSRDFSMGVGGSSAVPLPGAACLLGSGLVGLVGWRRFRKN